MLTQVAVPVQVYALSHSSLMVGLVGMAGLVPIVVFGLYGGAIADAIDRRVLYFWSSLGTWAVTLALLVQTLAGGALGGADPRPGRGAVGVLRDRVVHPRRDHPAHRRRRARAGGEHAELHRRQRRAGGRPAHRRRARVPAARLRLRLRHRRRCCSPRRCTRRCGCPRIPPDGTGQKLGLRSVVEGLAFIATRPVLVMSFAVDICAMVLAMPRALFPAVADERFGGDVGPLYAAIAIGAVVAGLSSGWIGRVRRQGRALTFAIIGWGGAVALAGLAHRCGWRCCCSRWPVPPTSSAPSTGRRSCRPTPRTRCADACRACSSPSSRAVRASATCARARTAAATGPTFSWVGGGIACMAVVRGGRRVRAAVLALRRAARRTSAACRGWTLSAPQWTITRRRARARRWSRSARGCRATASATPTSPARTRRRAAAAGVRRHPRALAQPHPRRPLRVRRRDAAAGRDRARQRQRHPRAGPVGALVARAARRRRRADPALRRAAAEGLPVPGAVRDDVPPRPGRRADGHASRARNRGDVRAPFGAGSHPYLATYGHRIDDVTLQLPARTGIDLDDAADPGRLAPPVRRRTTSARGRRLRERRFDDAFTGLARTDGARGVRAAHAQRRHPAVVRRVVRLPQVFTVDELTPGRAGHRGRADELPGERVQLRRRARRAGAGRHLDRQLGRRPALTSVAAR